MKLRRGEPLRGAPKLPNVRIVYDESRTVKLIVEAMNDTTHRAVEIQAIDVRTRHLMRTNVSKLSGEQLRTLECSIEDYRELAELPIQEPVLGHLWAVRQGICIGGPGPLVP